MSDQFDHGYALLVGVDESQLADYALPDVAKDVAALRDVLVHPQRCAYPTDHVKVLTGPEATRNGILDGLAWLEASIADDASENATAIVYYTGHGLRSGSSASKTFYLVPYDIREGRIGSRSLRAEDIAAEIEALAPRRLLVVLDCCHAGGMGVKGATPSEAFTPMAVPPTWLAGKDVSKGVMGAKGLDALGVGQGRAVLSSSTGKQNSYIRLDHRMSIFTYHLIEALTGHAQPQEGASEVLVSDVMGHVSRRVPRSVRVAYGRLQEPQFVVTGNFPIALLLGGEGVSKGRPAPDPLDALPETPAFVRYEAKVEGSGAVAQGDGAVAAGERGVAIGGNAGGTIITGDGNVVGDHSSSEVSERREKGKR